MSAPQRHAWTLSPRERGLGLQDFLRERLDVSNRQAKNLLDQRVVFVNGHRVWMAKHALAAGDRVEVDVGAAAPKTNAAPVPLVYEDEWIVAADKPAGLVTDRDEKSLEALLRRQLDLPTLRALHRLDRDTTGVLMFNRREAEREPYVELFRQRRMRKTYQAVLRGNPGHKPLTLKTPLDGKEAVTELRPLSHRGIHAWIECEIPTGRTHQIRRHLQGISCLVVGDRQYGTREEAPPAERSLPHQLLHACRVEWSCPHTGLPRRAEAPLPPAFRDFLKRQGFPGQA